MIELYEKIRDCSGVGLHGWYETSVGLIRKPNNKISTIKEIEKFEEDAPKVGEIKKQTNMKKLLLVLNAENKWHRLIRRGIVIGFLTAVALIIKEGLMPVASDSYVVLFTAILAFLDKAIRELAKE